MVVPLQKIEIDKNKRYFKKYIDNLQISLTTSAGKISAILHTS